MAEAESFEALAEEDGGRLAAASGRVGLLAAVDETVEKCSGGDDYSACGDGTSVAEAETLDVASVAFAGDDEVGDLGLLDLQVGLGFEDFAHFDAVLLLVTLSARRPDGWASGGVEEAKLDADGIGDFAHDATESVDFADDVSLGNASDGGVAAHLSNEVGVEREEASAQSHAGRSHGCLATGVTGSDYGDVEVFRKGHGQECLSLLF